MKEESDMAFELPDLPYPYDALEPSIDARTMEIHHDKHHRAYTNNLNAAIKGTELEGLTIEEILARGVDGLPAAVRNNGGGYYNHNIFWTLMSPNGGGEPVGELAKAITATFGSFEEFKQQFSNAGATQFGSGWSWLVAKPDGSLAVYGLPNQDSPLMTDDRPLLGVDVWEHAYYLKYQNRRPEYLEAWWNVVNWEDADRRYAATR
jgi:Fe-Mn family superoxide dismutase